MKKYLAILVVVAIMISLFGCSGFSKNGNNKGNDYENPQSSSSWNEGKNSIKLKLYFPAKDNDSVIEEEREITAKDNEVMKAAVEALIDGPENSELRKPMPEGTKLLGIEKEGNVAVVNFSKEYSDTNDIEEFLEWVSVVNTLTEFEEIEKVRILVEGADLIGPSGQPYGELSRVELDDSLMSQNGRKQTITLYFGDSEAEFLVPEKREVELETGKSIEEAVINELIRGPKTENTGSVVPKGTKLISAETKEGLCTLNLSKEFIDNNNNGSAGEIMTVYSIVNSLTELQGVNKVQFLIEGEKREVYKHMAFDTPIERDENIIKK